jgi:hypothetical protein
LLTFPSEPIKQTIIITEIIILSCSWPRKLESYKSSVSFPFQQTEAYKSERRNVELRE